MKNNLIKLEMMKQLLHKKLEQIEKEIGQIKGDNTYEQEARIQGSN
jgi:hypothetical protein